VFFHPPEQKLRIVLRFLSVHKHKFHTRINSIKKNQQSATGVHNKEKPQWGQRGSLEKLERPRSLGIFLIFVSFFFFESAAAASTVSIQKSQRHCHKTKLNGEQGGDGLAWIEGQKLNRPIRSGSGSTFTRILPTTNIWSMKTTGSKNNNSNNKRHATPTRKISTTL